MAPDTRLQASKEITYAELDGEALVLHVGTGQYFGLNKLGLDVLEIAKEPLTFAELVDELLARYDVSRDQLAADLEAFLGDLRERSLITIG